MFLFLVHAFTITPTITLNWVKLWRHSDTFSHTSRNWSILITCKWHWLPHSCQSVLIFVWMCLGEVVRLHLSSIPTAVLWIRSSRSLWGTKDGKWSSELPYSAFLRHQVHWGHAGCKKWTICEYRNKIQYFKYEKLYFFIPNYNNKEISLQIMNGL